MIKTRQTHVMVSLALLAVVFAGGAHGVAAQTDLAAFLDTRGISAKMDRIAEMIGLKPHSVVKEVIEEEKQDGPARESVHQGT